MKVIFAKPSQDIPSYRDFFRLAELSGFEVREGTIERKENEVYICIFHYNPDFIGQKGKVITWFLERVSCCGDDHFYEFIKRIKEDRKLDEIWVSDLSMWKLINNISRFVPIGSHEKISPLSTGRTYDIADMCFRYGRRNFISNLKCKIAPLCFYPERDQILSQSAFMLNVHQDEDHYFEPLRFCLAAAAGIPIITETCFNPFPYEGKDLIQSEYKNICPTIYRVISEGYDLHKKNANEMRKMILSNYCFRDCVIRAIGDK